ncbi:sulfotransferase family protein [Paucidesulfovibrio longus]|uniref:sulfotransferase family protein n=1 Tax=Paucidesulfovibrio longus TaxID=889 RepID=UPI0003B7B0D8|nr:sulfotransferase [Paucidesulfovibrio longus]
MSAGMFFLIGAQRSGTTLLRLMLNAHPELAVPEEGTFWMPLLRSHGNRPEAVLQGRELANLLDYVRANSQFRLWGLDDAEARAQALAEPNLTPARLMEIFYAAYARSRGKTRAGDKTPSFFRMVPALATLFPQARFIHILRDGRDIHLSLKSMGVSSGLAVDALEWTHKVTRARRDLAALPPERVCELRYEDLLAAPEERLRAICALLELPFDPAMLDFWKTSGKYIGSHHSERIFQPIAPDNVRKWERRMAPADIRAFQAVAGRTLAELGYDPGPPPGPLDRLRAGLALSWGVPARLSRVASTALRLGLASRLGLATDAAGKGEAAKNLDP